VRVPMVYPPRILQPRLEAALRGTGLRSALGYVEAVREGSDLYRHSDHVLLPVIPQVRWVDALPLDRVQKVLEIVHLGLPSPQQEARLQRAERQGLVTWPPTFAPRGRPEKVLGYGAKRRTGAGGIARRSPASPRNPPRAGGECSRGGGVRRSWERGAGRWRKGQGAATQRRLRAREKQPAEIHAKNWCPSSYKRSAQAGGSCQSSTASHCQQKCAMAAAQAARSCPCGVPLSTASTPRWADAARARPKGRGHGERVGEARGGGSTWGRAARGDGSGVDGTLRSAPPVEASAHVSQPSKHHPAVVSFRLQLGISRSGAAQIESARCEATLRAR
jgi:hypothetical protein